MADTLFVAIINILAGILILAFPGMLRVLVGGYLILIGAITLLAVLL